MYTIKNISSKIIHIGTTVLMPEDTMMASAAVANTPAVQAMAGRKMLAITAPVVEKPKQEETPVADGEGEESDEDKAPEKTKGARRTTKDKTGETDK